MLVSVGGADVNGVDSSGNSILHRALLAFSAVTIEDVVGRMCRYILTLIRTTNTIYVHSNTITRKITLYTYILSLYTRKLTLIN